MTPAQADGMRYMVEPYLLKRWERVGRKLAFTARTIPAWKTWRRQALAKLKQLTGYDTMLECPLKSRITETQAFPDYTRQRIELQTEPGVILTMYALIPKTGKPPYPVVINPHGHVSGGKLSPAGCSEIPELTQTIKDHNYDYGVQYVRAGFIAFCPDARGFGERQERAARETRQLLTSSCLLINNMAIPLGQTVTGMWAWDLHRLIDYIATRNDCRADRLGCAGLSGGGLQTLWAAALDERIRCCVISGYFYGYRESLLVMHQNCSCNYVPHLYEYMDMGDIGALIAPRPALIETGTRDPLNGASGLKNVTSQVRIMRRAYRLLKADPALVHDIFEGEHRWHGTVAIPWMRQLLQ
jgi:dienelactone hydrolase